MRFTSLVVELIRARPRLVVWIVVLVQAALWLILPMLLYRSPPGDLATVLAYGREYQVGTWLGPPLAFWFADIAFRAAGNTMFGVYLLAQVCAVATFWIYYQLARAIVGGQQAVLAVLLSMTVVAFSSPGVEFGPLVLARPLWALLLLHSWQLIGQNRRNAWFAWSIEAGLLLLTISAAPVLLLLLAGFAAATERGRRVLTSLDPLYALLVIVVLVLPYLIWLLRADVLAMPPWPAISDLGARVMQWGWLLGGLVLAASAILLLVLLNSGWFARSASDAPIIYRPPVDPLARDFVYFFAVAPAVVGSLIAGIFNLDRIVGGAAVALLMTGLAVVVATGDLIFLRRQRLLRTVWAAAVVAPAVVTIATIVSCPGPDRRSGHLAAGKIDRAIFRRQLRAPHQSAAAGGRRRSATGGLRRDEPRPTASAARRHAGTDAVAVGGEIQRDRRRRGLARFRYVGRAAARDRAALSGPRAGSASCLRMAGQRPPAAVARRLGHRTAESAVSWIHL